MPNIEDIPRHAKWSLDEQLLRETAYHEAGHAVLAKLTGTYLVGAITGDTTHEHGAFQCEYRPDLQLARDAALGLTSDAQLEYAVISAAGAAAQALFMHKSDIGLDGSGNWTQAAQVHVYRGAQSDIEQVQAKLGAGHWERVRKIAEQWFGDESIWRAVEVLAAEIIRRGGVLPRETVDDVLHMAFVDLSLPDFQALA